MDRRIQTYPQTSHDRFMIAAWDSGYPYDDFIPTHDIMLDEKGDIVGQHLFAWNGGGKDYYSMEWGSDPVYKRDLGEVD